MLALGGLLAGFVHVLSGPDHLAAIAPYAVDDRSSAWRKGVRWGLGHSAGVLGVGLAALLVRDRLPIERLSTWAEDCVGLVLIGIGFWALRAALAARLDVDQRDHSQRQHAHAHAAFGVGTLHGLAGSSHLLGILPALAMPSNFAAALYLLLFGAGSIAAMGTFSTVLGRLASPVGATRVITRSTLLALSAVLAFSVGAFWLFDAFWVAGSVTSLG